MRKTETDLTLYLERLRDLPFVTDAELVARSGDQPDALHANPDLRLCTPDGTHDLEVEVKRTHLTRTIVDGVLARRSTPQRRPWVLFARYIGRPIGQHLIDHEVNFLDEAGNCRLQLGRQYFALVQGNRKRPVTRGRGIGIAGYRVLFALLAREDLLNAPVRTIAAEAEASKNAAAHALRHLTDDGLIGEQNGRRRFIDRPVVLDRWLAGYATAVRPKLMVGRFRTPDRTPQDLENRIEDTLDPDEPWVWGGGAAAMRLTQFYRGQETVLHTATWGPRVAKQLRALRATDGPLVVLRPLEDLALEGVVPRTAHPLMVYTELLAAGDPRAREAAAEIQQRYLTP